MDGGAPLGLPPTRPSGVLSRLHTFRPEALLSHCRPPRSGGSRDERRRPVRVFLLPPSRGSAFGPAEDGAFAHLRTDTGTVAGPLQGPGYRGRRLPCRGGEGSRIRRWRTPRACSGSYGYGFRVDPPVQPGSVRPPSAAASDRPGGQQCPPAGMITNTDSCESERSLPAARDRVTSPRSLTRYGVQAPAREAGPGIATLVRRMQNVYNVPMIAIRQDAPRTTAHP